MPFGMNPDFSFCYSFIILNTKDHIGQIFDEAELNSIYEEQYFFDKQMKK